jgi:TetR/AcrR family transcriptional regulator, fatty acid metabolism regulator protein
MADLAKTEPVEATKDTRRRILEAAIQVFSKKGYHDTRVDEIVEEASISKGGIYFHFPGKHQIFLAVVDEFARLLEERLTTAIAEEVSGIRQVNAALQAGLETFGQYRQLAKIFLVQAVGLGAAFEEKRLEVHDRFASLIRKHLDRAVAENDIPAIDTEVAAYTWTGAINEVIIRWIYTGQPEPARALPVLRSMLLRSVGVTEEQLRRLDGERGA